MRVVGREVPFATVTDQKEEGEEEKGKLSASDVM